MSLLIGAGQFGLAELAEAANKDKQAVEAVMNNIGIFSPSSMNSLRSQPGLTGTRVELLGYTRSGDGGGGYSTGMPARRKPMTALPSLRLTAYRRVAINASTGGRSPRRSSAQKRTG